MIKGIGIILIVLGHCIQYGSGANFFEYQLFYSSIVFRVIYSFRMPEFMIISGFLFWYSSEKQDGVKLVLSKIKSFGVPIVGNHRFFQLNNHK